MASVLRTSVRAARRLADELRLPEAARAERARDRQGLPAADPGIDRAVDETAAWLGRAQDHSTSHDGGVAHHYSLRSGWSPSYPETTGYIVPSLLDWAELRGDAEARERARRMLDWLVAIQTPEGGFQGGVIGTPEPRPVAFNAGQILLGLARGVREFGEPYREAMRRAADWLTEIQDPDGCWRRFATPFARTGDKTYDVHAGWGLLEAARLEPGRPWGAAALANARWALGFQRDNGWIDHASQDDPERPTTHPLGYTMKGLFEAYRFSDDERFLTACRRMADGALRALGEDGFLPGRLTCDWRGAVPWASLTGSVQIAHVWLQLHAVTGEARYREAGCLANRWVRRTLRVDGPEATRGGVKGCFPVDGDFGAWCYLNWAAKFFIDSNLAERALSAG